MTYVRSSEGSDCIMHYGVKEMKHGHRRWQNPDGSLTDAGFIHYYGHPRIRGQNEKDYDKQDKAVKENAHRIKSGSSHAPSPRGGNAHKKEGKELGDIDYGMKKALDFAKEKTAQAKVELDKLREERLKKNKEKWLKDPNLLWKNRDKFTKEEIDAAMEKFRSEKELEDFNSARKKEQDQKDREAKLQAEKDAREARIQAEKDEASRLEREKRNKEQEADRKAQKEREKEEYERQKRNAAADDVAATVARTANMAANLFNIANTFSTATTGRTLPEIAWQKYNRSLDQKMKDINTEAVSKEAMKIFKDEGGKYDKKTGKWVDNTNDGMASKAAAVYFAQQTAKFDKDVGYTEKRKPYSGPNQKVFDAQWPPWMTGGGNKNKNKNNNGGNNGGGKN